MLLCPWIHGIEKSFFNFCYFSVEDRKMCQLEMEEEKKEIFAFTRFCAWVLGLELLPLDITNLLYVLLAVLPVRSGAQEEEEEPLNTVKWHMHTWGASSPGGANHISWVAKFIERGLCVRLLLWPKEHLLLLSCWDSAGSAALEPLWAPSVLTK